MATSQATGVKLNFQPVPDADWLAKQKVWMATKQVPDVMRSAFAEIRDFADPSVFKPVLPLIEKSGPNIKKYLAAYPEEVKKLKMNGDLYIIPATSYNTKLLAPMPCIRKDLLDKIGMPVPDDFEKIYQALKEIKKANPNVVGWTARKPGSRQRHQARADDHCLSLTAAAWAAGARASTCPIGRRPRARASGCMARSILSSRKCWPTLPSCTKNNCSTRLCDRDTGSMAREEQQRQRCLGLGQLQLLRALESGHPRRRSEGDLDAYPDPQGNQRGAPERLHWLCRQRRRVVHRRRLQEPGTRH